MANKKNWYYILYTMKFVTTSDGSCVDKSKSIPIKTTQCYNDDDWYELGEEAIKQGLLEEEDLVFIDDLEPITKKEYDNLISKYYKHSIC